MYTAQYRSAQYAWEKGGWKRVKWMDQLVISPSLVSLSADLIFSHTRKHFKRCACAATLIFYSTVFVNLYTKEGI